MAASERGHINIARMLLEKGAEVNAEGPSGPAFMVASLYGHTEIVQILFENGADVHAGGFVDTAFAKPPPSRQEQSEVLNIILHDGAEDGCSDIFEG